MYKRPCECRIKVRVQEAEHISRFLHLADGTKFVKYWHLLEPRPANCSSNIARSYLFQCWGRFLFWLFAVFFKARDGMEYRKVSKMVQLAEDGQA